MGTGSPSVTISGVSAANMVLRRLGKKEYIWRKGMKDYVKEYRASDLPHLKTLSHISANSLEDGRFNRLHDDASLCQWCEEAPCLEVCPANYDIRGLLRRIEVGNYKGAYAILMDKNRENVSDSFGCIDCPAPCNAACMRKKGSVTPVKIKSTMVELVKLISNTL
jgi:prolycopene isomerase